MEAFQAAARTLRKSGALQKKRKKCAPDLAQGLAHDSTALLFDPPAPKASADGAARVTPLHVARAKREGMERRQARPSLRPRWRTSPAKRASFRGARENDAANTVAARRLPALHLRHFPVPAALFGERLVALPSQPAPGGAFCARAELRNRRRAR